MKKKFLACLGTLMLAFCCFVFAGCGGSNAKSIIRAEIIDGELIITYSDNTTDNLGKVVGSQGATGPAGANGTNGTNGSNGKTPYIGSNGNWYIGDTDTGVKAEGTQGATGPAGANGTNGTNGSDGKTPYIGSNGNWYIGDTDTGVKAEGTQGATGSSGADGIGITGITSEYGVNDQNQECMIFTFTMSDGSTQTVYCVIPKEVTYVQADTVYLPVLEEQPEFENLNLEITVYYEDDSSENIVLKEAMITSGEVNCTQVGQYQLEGSYQGHHFGMTVFVYDPENPQVVDVQANVVVGESTYEPFVIWQYREEEDTKVVENYDCLSLTIRKNDGTIETVPITSDMVTYTCEASDQAFVATVTYQEQYQGKFYVLPLSSLNDVSVHYDGPDQLTCGINEDPFANTDDYLMGEKWHDGEYSGNYRYCMKPTKDMLKNTEEVPFDASTSSEETEYYFYIGEQRLKSSVFISVVDWDALTFDHFELNPYAVRVTDGSLPELSISFVYRNEEYQTFTRPIGTLTEEMLLNGDELDFTQAGEVTISFVYNEEEYEVDIVLYDPDVNNIRDIYISEMDNVIIPSDADLNEFLSAYIAEHQPTLWIDYFEDREEENNLPVTVDFFDLESLDLSIFGSQQLTYSYQGVTGSVSVMVQPSLEGAEVTGTLQVSDPMLSGMLAETVTLYDNGIAVLDDSDASWYASYTKEDSDTLVLTFQGSNLLLKIEESALVNYTTEAAAKATYTASQSVEGMPDSILVYDEMIAVSMMGTNLYFKETLPEGATEIVLIGIRFVFNHEDQTFIIAFE